MIIPNNTCFDSSFVNHKILVGLVWKMEFLFRIMNFYLEFLFRIKMEFLFRINLIGDAERIMSYLCYG